LPEITQAKQSRRFFLAWQHLTAKGVALGF